MSRILFLTLVFPPDAVSTAQILGDLARDLRAKGHEINVLTTVPHYNRDPEAENRQPLRPFWGRVLKKSEYYGMPVFHTMMPKKGSSVPARLIAWTGFHILSAIAGLIVLPKPDLILAPSPPLTMGVVARLLGWLRGAPFIYSVHEIYPDIAIHLGALKNRTLIRFLYGLERFVYRRAASITVIAPGMLRNLIGKGVPRDKLVLIPDCADVDDFYPQARENSFSRRYGLIDTFTISYAGNLGVPQGLDVFLEAAHLLRENPAIRFLMLGDGMQREFLLRRLAELSLPNFSFMPHQPYSLMPLIYASSDANLVPQAGQTESDAVPSKIFRIMACGRPVIAVTHSSSDLAQLVRDAGCGVVAAPDSATELAEKIVWAFQHQAEWRTMGESGRRFVIQHYSRKAVADRYDQLIRSLLSGIDASPSL